MMKTLLLVSILCLIGIIQVEAQESTRSYLSGNWGGFRDSLNQAGISIKPRVTLFNQNFVAGIGDNKSVLNGKAQIDLLLNGKKLGLSNLTLVTKFEYNFGRALDDVGATLIPKNTAITFPGFSSGNRFDLSSLYLVYSWEKGNRVLFGKINMVDLAAGTTYSGGAGLDAFWSLGFAAPVSGITPPYIFGAVASMSGEKLNWTFMIYDPKSAVGTSGLNNLFREGIVLSASPSWKVNIGNHVGDHALRFTFSTQDGSIPYSLGDLNIPVDFPTSNKSNRFFVSYSFNHPLKTFGTNNENWGLFGQIAFSDGNPNPVDFSALLGIGGNSMIKNRSSDHWGVGLYYYSLSSYIDDLASVNSLQLRNELGLESYYQYWLNPWFSLGGNIQVVDPILEEAGISVFLGLRTSIKF